MEVRGKNYFLPIDFPKDSTELSVNDDAYSAQDLLEKIEASGAQVRLIVFDACRDNPLPVASRSLARGLIRMEGQGTLFMFATVNPKDGLTYVWIPAGRFIMGCSRGDSDCDNDEKPSHEVEITKVFWIGQTEVR